MKIRSAFVLLAASLLAAACIPTGPPGEAGKTVALPTPEAAAPAAPGPVSSAPKVLELNVEEAAPAPGLPAAQTDVPAPAPEPSEPAEDEVDLQTMMAGMQGPGSRPTMAAEVVPLPDGNYTVSGSHGLNGTIRHGEDENSWVFDATLTFEEAGHTVGDIRITTTLAQVLSADAAAEPETITLYLINIPIPKAKEPEEGLPAGQKQRLHHVIEAPADARFVINLEVM